MIIGGLFFLFCLYLIGGKELAGGVVKLVLGVGLLLLFL
jgi:hypothetical protein